MLKRGFTLVEFLLYIAIVSVVLSVAGATMLNVLFGKAKLSALQEVSQNARFSLGKMTDAISGSAGIIAPLPSATSSTLSLLMDDVSKSPTVFSIVSGTLFMQEGLASSSRIISSKIKVSDLEFFNLSSANTPGAIKIRMKIQTVNQSGRPEYDFKETLYAASNIRKK